jgi:hypothetical protein
MDSPRTLGVVQVALTVQVVIAVARIEALLSGPDREIGRTLAGHVDVIVRGERLGYYPALDFFTGHAGMPPALLEAHKNLAAQLRKRIKRDVQTRLWPVFSSVQIERTVTLAFNLAHVTPSQPGATEQLALHLFPNAVRLELRLGTLDKQHRLEEAEKFTAQKVVRNLRDDFESVNVTTTRRLTGLDDPDHG